MSARRQVAATRDWWGRSIGGLSWKRIRQLDLDTHALALCAQQVLCTAPLIVAMSAVLQRESGHGGGFILTKFFGLHGDSESAVERLFGRSAPSISTLALIFAMVTAIVFSTSVAAVQQRAFEMIWTLPRVIGVRSYLRQLTWAVMLGIYSASVLLAGRASRVFASAHHDKPAIIAAVVIQGFLTFLYYWWSQRWLLGGRVSWRALLPGSIWVGVGTTVLFRLTRVIMPGQISWQVHAYGLIGCVFVLSVWLMILSGVIFGGVLIGALTTQRRTDPGLAATMLDVEQSPLTLAGLASSAGEAQDKLPTAG